MAIFKAEGERGCGCLTIGAVVILILCGVAYFANSKRKFSGKPAQPSPPPSLSPAPSPSVPAPSPIAIATPKATPTPARRERVKLTAASPLYLEDEFHREGAAGEEFEVWMRRPDLKKVFVLSRGWEGKQVVLNVREEFVVTTSDPEPTER